MQYNMNIQTCSAFSWLKLKKEGKEPESNQSERHRTVGWSRCKCSREVTMRTSFQKDSSGSSAPNRPPKVHGNNRHSPEQTCLRIWNGLRESDPIQVSNNKGKRPFAVGSVELHKQTTRLKIYFCFSSDYWLSHFSLSDDVRLWNTRRVSGRTSSNNLHAPPNCMVGRRTSEMNPTSRYWPAGMRPAERT